MNFQLSLILQWFLLTKQLIKKEDYRNVSAFWCSRLLLFDGTKRSQNFWEHLLLAKPLPMLLNVFKDEITFKVFDVNIMTLGYPKSADTDKILKFEHAGIEIRTGNPEWGAEPNTLYFVIKHGKQIQ